MPELRGPGGRSLRLVHLTTVDMSLVLLLGTELEMDIRSGLETVGVSAPGPYAARLAGMGVRHVAVESLTRSWSPGADARAALELYRVLRRLRPDVLHTHTPKAGVLGRVLGRVLRVPVVVNTCHGVWTRPDQHWVTRRAVLTAEGIVGRLSHAELYQNAEDARALRRWTGGHATVVWNGTDLSRFHPDPTARARFRRWLGVDDGQVLVGGVGRLVREKGVYQFAATAGALRDRAVFVWAGPDDRSRGDAAHPVGPVRLLGDIEDMPGLYNALDVFVLPSFREGFSRSAMEAAATGRAMVLSDIRGCREIGAHGREVLLVPAGNESALISAVDRLVEDPALRERLGSAAYERAVAAFDQSQVADASIRTYAAVAERRRLRWMLRESPC